MLPTLVNPSSSYEFFLKRQFEAKITAGFVQFFIFTLLIKFSLWRFLVWSSNIATLTAFLSSLPYAKLRITFRQGEGRSRRRGSSNQNPQVLLNHAVMVSQTFNL